MQPGIWLGCASPTWTLVKLPPSNVTGDLVHLSLLFALMSALLVVVKPLTASFVLKSCGVSFITENCCSTVAYVTLNSARSHWEAFSFCTTTAYIYTQQTTLLSQAACQSYG